MTKNAASLDERQTEILHNARCLHHIMSELGDVAYDLVDDELYSKEDAVEAILKVMNFVESLIPETRMVQAGNSLKLAE